MKVSIADAEKKAVESGAEAFVRKSADYGEPYEVLCRVQV